MLKETHEETRKRLDAQENEKELRKYWRDRWVDTRGGRTSSDILYDNEGAYILMHLCPAHMILCGSEFERVYIPSTETIIKELS